MTPTKIGMISLGCSKNLVDSEHMLAKLREDGCVIVDEAAQADIAVINTCGFIEAAVNEAIETILQTAQLKKDGGLKGIIVTGCMAERYRDTFAKELPEVDAVLGTGSYEEIVSAVHKVRAGERAEYFRDTASAALEGARERLTPSYTAYFKIAEGCSNTCAYCIIPKLRGPYRSRNMEELLEEAVQLSKAGVKELIVIAQDITKYGTDIYGRKMLPELLNKLCELDFTWIRLHYLYPDQITHELIDVIAGQDKIVKYLDIPLQHVSRRILRAMRRPGDGQAFRALIDKLRREIPGVVLRTSLIVGLPGETEEEFEELCAFLQEVQLERAGVFCYSREEGTLAAEMPGQIDEETKNRRRFIVEELQSAAIDEYNLSCLHQEMQILCEGYDEAQQAYFGRSYADSVEVDGTVYFTAARQIAPGEFVSVRIDDCQGADLIGVCLEG